MSFLVSAYNGGTLRSKFRNVRECKNEIAPEPERVLLRAIPWEVQQVSSVNESQSSKRCCDPVTTEGAWKASNEMATRHQTPTPLRN